MPVFKNKTQGQYVNVYKDILKNHSLSLRDRGMVVTLISLRIIGSLPYRD